MVVKVGERLAAQQLSFSREYLEGLYRCLSSLDLDEVAQVLQCVERAYWAESQVFVMGNGGSSALASHLACDLGKNIVSPGSHERVRRLRILSLTDNVPWITALANDLGYEHVFSEQLRNLVLAGDLVLLFSGSGSSPNVVEAAKVGKAAGATVAAILGFDGGELRHMVDYSVLVPSTNYGHIEDTHSAIAHLLTRYMMQVCNEESKSLEAGVGS